MIKVSIKKDKIVISGHALYDNPGKDIVCSSASSIVTTTINGIISIDENAIKYKLNKNGLEIEILKSDDVTLKLIDNMNELLVKLSRNYPKNIQVKEGV